MCIKSEERDFFKLEPKLLTHDYHYYEGFNKRCNFGRDYFLTIFPSIGKKTVKGLLIKISDKLSVLENEFLVIFYYKKD